MKHYSAQEWRKFISGELSPFERELYERHLYGCDCCLQVYMECVEHAADELPLLSNEDEFAEKVMSGVVPAKGRVWHNPLFQYAVAACITFLLLASGVFHDIAACTAEMNVVASSLQHESLSAKLMEKTVSVLDAISDRR